MLRQLGNIIGCLCSLFFPFKQPKRDYLILTSVKCILLLLMPLAKAMDEEVAKVFLSLLMVGFGLLKVQLSCVYYIVGKWVLTKDNFSTLKHNRRR